MRKRNIFYSNNIHALTVFIYRFTLRGNIQKLPMTISVSYKYFSLAEQFIRDKIAFFMLSFIIFPCQCSYFWETKIHGNPLKCIWLMYIKFMSGGESFRPSLGMVWRFEQTPSPYSFYFQNSARKAGCIEITEIHWQRKTNPSFQGPSDRPGVLSRRRTCD